MPDEGRKKVDTKIEDEDKKNWKSEFDFWIFHVKISLYENFNENLRRESLTYSLRLLTNRSKSDDVNENMQKCVRFLSSPYQN